MRYAELRPDQLEAAIRENPVAIWPIGALEWHGAHLPLGLDGMTAEAFAERLQAKVGGVLLPCLWHPMTTLPHPFSLDVATETFVGIVSQTLFGLGRAGFKVVCVVTGHYAQGHSLELFSLASRAPHGMAVLAASPLEPLEDDDLLDHAARWETAQLAAIRPQSIDLATLPEVTTPKAHAVLGEHPRLGQAKEAEAKGAEALDVWASWVQSAANGDLIEVKAFYARRREHYRPYLEAYYRGSWEHALRSWWDGQT